MSRIIAPEQNLLVSMVMTQSEAFQANGKFWAKQFFPKGIGRSGHFSKEQSQLLENHGLYYQALFEGKTEPVGEEELAFVEVFKGLREAESPHERAWKKFLEVTNHQFQVHYSVGSSSAPSVDFSAYVDDGGM